MKIPFVDLKAQLSPIRGDVMASIERVVSKCNFVMGEELAQFESEFAKFSGAQYAVGVSSGLDAIHLAVRALGIGPGDEVIVPAHTFIASALGVTMAGATPVFVDVNEDFLMDVNALERVITPKTKAILPVHLYGQMVDLEPVINLATKRGLAVIEDAAQAHGARKGARRAGAVGQLGCFSFYPGKNLGCYGDGGAVTTNSRELRDKLEALRNYGSTQKYHHPVIGFNCRLDTIQAAILSVKLPRLEGYNAARFQVASWYQDALRGLGDLILPEMPGEGRHVFHLYVVRTKKRDALLRYLQEHGVGAGIHYPVPMHLHGAYAHLGYRVGDFPVSERICSEILSLPIFPELTRDQVGTISKLVQDFFLK